jgi:outer membrane immunogenic protein
LKKLWPAYAVLAAFSVAHPAMGADLGPIVKASPAAVVANNWTGSYVGIHIGYGWEKTSVDISVVGDPTNDAESIPRSLHTSPAGFMGGGQIGYNAQFGFLLLGVEADLAYSHIKGSDSAAPVIAGFDVKTTTAQQEIDWFGTVRGRIGWVPFDRSLFYVTGGLAYGHVKLSNSVISQSGCGGGFFCTSDSISKVRAGWTAGAGWENMLTERLSAKAEYLYYDLGTLSLADPPTEGVVFRADNGQFRGNIVRFGLNYKL